MFNGIIYKVTSPIGKKYYGQTIQKFNRRKNRHLMDAKYGSTWRFHQALRKYNYDVEWETIEVYNNEDKRKLIDKLNERETFWVKKDKTNFLNLDIIVLMVVMAQ